MTKTSKARAAPFERRTHSPAICALALVGVVTACTTTRPETATLSRSLTTTVADSSETPRIIIATVPNDPMPSAIGTKLSDMAIARAGIDRSATPEAVIEMSPWATFRTVWFISDRASLDDSEIRKLGEVILYLALNPAAEVGIDSTTDSKHAEPENRRTYARRIDTVRNALLEDGVPASRIKVGAFGNRDLAFEQRVAVLVRNPQ